MKIAVCDDEISQIHFLSALIKNWSEDRKHTVSADCFGSAEEFWFNYSKDKYDIILLDIQMTGESGIELSKKLRAIDDSSAIIFVTAVTDYISEGYDVDAVHYLIKPIDEEKFFTALDKAAKSKAIVRKKVTVQTDEGFINIFEDEIEAVEAFSHSSCVHLKDKSLEIHEGFGELSAKLSPNLFVQCHRSYAVNLARVDSFVKYEVTLESGRKIPISRRIFRDFTDKFISLYKGKI